MRTWLLLGVLFLLVVGGCAPPMVLLIAMTSTLPSGGELRPPETVDGIPPVLLDAYHRGAARLTGLYPRCTGMTRAILAGIGRIESTHGAGHDIAPNGDVTPPFVGPRLDGSGVGGNLTPQYDTDDGTLGRRHRVRPRGRPHPAPARQLGPLRPRRQRRRRRRSAQRLRLGAVHRGGTVCQRR